MRVRLAVIGAILSLLVPGFGTDTARGFYPQTAETECTAYKTWSDPAVCGVSSVKYAWGNDSVWDSRSNPLDGVVVEKYILWSRGYSSYGGWHQVSDTRIPGGTSWVSQPPTDYVDILFLPMGHQVGGQYECNLAACYGVARHRFWEGDGQPNYPERLFYTSHDAAHSTYACWEEATPGC